MIIPTAKQFKAIAAAANQRYIVHYGSVRSGKTVSVCFSFPVLIDRHKGQEGLNAICSKTLRNVELNILRPAREIYGNFVGFIKDKSYVIIFGERFEIFPFNDDSSYQKIQGATIKLCIMDEATLSPESFFQMMLSRLSTKDSQLIMTMNPGSPQHYLKRYIDDEFVDQERKERKAIYKWTIEDNPTLDSLYISGLKNAYKGNKSLYERYILGNWTAADGLAYYSFNEERNTVRNYDLPRLQKNTRVLLIGIDGAVVKDSTACCPLFISMGDMAFVGRRFKYNPQSFRPLSSTEQVDLIERYINDLDKEYGWRSMNLDHAIMVCDCAATDLLLQLRYRFGGEFDVLAFTKKDQKKMVGVVNNLFANDKMIVERARDFDYISNAEGADDSLVTELGSVEIKDTDTGLLVLKPEIPNDVTDALKYAAAYYYGGDEIGRENNDRQRN